jgi:Ca2+/Na+ antiporter
MQATPNTRVDWWIILRDTIFIVVYISLVSVFLYGNNVESWKAITMLGLYFLHILLMKYNHIYEVAVKKSVARRLEVSKLKRLAQEDVKQFHSVHASRKPHIDQLAEISYVVDRGFVTFDDFPGRKCKMPRFKNIGPTQEFLVDREHVNDKRPYNNFKLLVFKVNVKIQAFRIYQQLVREKRSFVSLTKYLQDYD